MNKKIIPIFLLSILLLLPSVLGNTYNINLTKENLTNGDYYELNLGNYFFTNPTSFLIEQPQDNYKYYFTQNNDGNIPLHDLLTGNKGLNVQLYYPHSLFTFPRTELLFLNNTNDFETQLNITSYGENGFLNPSLINNYFVTSSTSTPYITYSLRNDRLLTYGGNNIVSFTDDEYLLNESNNFNDESVGVIRKIYYNSFYDELTYLKDDGVYRYYYNNDSITKLITGNSAGYSLLEYDEFNDVFLYRPNEELLQGFYDYDFNLINNLDVDDVFDYYMNNKGYFFNQTNINTPTISTNKINPENDLLINTYNLTFNRIVYIHPDYDLSYVSLDDYLLTSNSLQNGLYDYVINDLTTLNGISYKQVNTTEDGYAYSFTKIEDEYYLIFLKDEDTRFEVTYYDIEFNKITSFYIDYTLSNTQMFFNKQYAYLIQKNATNPYPLTIRTYNVLENPDMEHTFNIYYTEQHEEEEEIEIDLISLIDYYWNMENNDYLTKLDEVSGYDFIFSGNSSLINQVNGKIGNAINIETGTSLAYYYSNDTSTLFPSNQNYTYGFWFKSNQIPSGDIFIFGNSVNNIMYRSSDCLWIGIRNTYKSNFLCGVSSIPEWTHLTVVYNHLNYAEYYLNGEYIETINRGTSSSQSLTKIFDFTPSKTFNISIDELFYSNSVLNSTEIKYLYDLQVTGDLTGSYPFSPPISQTNNISDISIDRFTTHTINLDNYFNDYNDYSLNFSNNIINMGDNYEDSNIIINTTNTTIKYTPKNNIGNFNNVLTISDYYNNEIVEEYNLEIFSLPFSGDLTSYLQIYNYSTYTINLSEYLNNFELVEYYLSFYNPNVSNLSDWELLGDYGINNYYIPELNINVNNTLNTITINYNSSSNTCRDLTLRFNPLTILEYENYTNIDYDFILNNTCYEKPQRTSLEFPDKLSFNDNYLFYINQYFEDEIYNEVDSFNLYILNEDEEFIQINNNGNFENDYYLIQKYLNYFSITTKDKETLKTQEIIISANNSEGNTDVVYFFDILESAIQTNNIPNINVPYNYNFDIDLNDYYNINLVDSFIFKLINEDGQTITKTFNKDQTLYEDNIYFTLSIENNVMNFTTKNTYLLGEYELTSYSSYSSLVNTDKARFRINDNVPQIVNPFTSIIMNYEQERIINFYDYFDFINEDFYYVSFINPDTLETIYLLPNEELDTSYFNFKLLNGVLSITSKSLSYDDKLTFGTCTGFTFGEEGTGDCSSQENVIFKISEDKTGIINDLFPSPDDLTNTQKFIRVFIVIGLIITLGVLLGFNNPSSRGYVVPLISVLVVFTFIYFVSIGYISTWILILSIFIGLVVGVGFFNRILRGNTSSE